MKADNHQVMMSSPCTLTAMARPGPMRRIPNPLKEKDWEERQNSLRLLPYTPGRGSGYGLEDTVLISPLPRMNSPDQPKSTPRILLAAAVHGAAAWCAYALIEAFLSGLWPLIRSRDGVLMPWFWHGTALLLVAYLALGAVVGLSVALILRTFRARITRWSLGAAGVCSLALASAANLLSQPEVPRSDQLGAALGLLVALNAALVIRSEAWEHRFGYLSGPFTGSLLALASPWLQRTLFPPETPWSGAVLPQSAVVKWASISAAVLIIVFVAKLGNRISQREIPDSGLFPRKRMLVAFASLVLIGVAFAQYFNRNPGLGLPPAPASASARPNVVFLSLDTVRADHMSLYGYSRATTPNLQALASDASVYQRAFAVADMTLASHASMFTGVYPRRHGAHYSPDQPLGRGLPGLPTMAEILSANGYSTAGIAANYAYLHPLFGFQRGFQIYDSRPPVQVFDPNHTFYLRRVARRVADRIVPMEQFDRLCRSAGEINGEVLPLLDKFAERKSPFFLFINYMDAHAPRMPPAEFKDRFPGRDPRMTSQSYYAIVKDVMMQKRALLPGERASAVSLYDASLAYLDDQVGLLIDRLKTLGIYENTMIVVTSDHGEAFGERDLMEHSVSVYQDQIAVPLLIKFPNSHTPKRVDTVVSHVDILPTILSALGLPAPNGIQGIDLDRNASGPPRTIISESYRNAMFAAWNRRFNRTESAIVSDRMKLIVSTAGKRELYDLAADPEERRNLAQTAVAVAADLTERLSEWMKTVPVPVQASVPKGRDNLQRLKSLGYAQ